MRATATLLVGMFLAGSACQSDEVPSIEIVDVSSKELRPDDDDLDDLVVRVHYHDGDGDLGGGRVAIYDCRDPAFVTRFDLAPIANTRGVDAAIVIEGELVVTVGDVEAITPTGQRPEACTEGEAAATAFCIAVEDEAGHRSEPACTGPIAVLPPS